VKIMAFMAGVWALLGTCNPTPQPINYSHLKCGQWANTALMVGWEHKHIPKLLDIMWKESRCQPEAIRRNARGNPVDVGLLQINQIHRQSLAQMGFSHMDMTEPAYNLMFGKVLFDWAERRGCGWAPWKATGGSC
jgi:hypothetical protein